MRKKSWLIVIAYLSSFPLVAEGQKKDTFFFNEYSISVNRTVIFTGDNTGDKFGFGLGLYRVMGQKSLNLIGGFEYNLTRQYIKRTDEGQFANATDLTYNLQNLSIPVIARLTSDNDKLKVFFEAGVFSDIILFATRSGTISSYAPDENDMIEYKSSEFKNKAQLSSINYGLQSGIGIIFPFGNFNLIIKPEYKYGLRNLNPNGMTSIFNSYFKLSIGLKAKEEEKQAS